jgi:hypothetical protein
LKKSHERRLNRFVQKEDELIMSLVHRLGTKWVEIAKHLPGRTSKSIKNRYYSALKKSQGSAPHPDWPMELKKTFALQRIDNDMCSDHEDECDDDHDDEESDEDMDDGPIELSQYPQFAFTTHTNSSLPSFGPTMSMMNSIAKPVVVQSRPAQQQQPLQSDNVNVPTHHARTLGPVVQPSAMPAALSSSIMHVTNSVPTNTNAITNTTKSFVPFSFSNSVLHSSTTASALTPTSTTQKSTTKIPSLHSMLQALPDTRDTPSPSDVFFLTPFKASLFTAAHTLSASTPASTSTATFRSFDSAPVQPTSFSLKSFSSVASSPPPFPAGPLPSFTNTPPIPSFSTPYASNSTYAPGVVIAPCAQKPKLIAAQEHLPTISHLSSFSHTPVSALISPSKRSETVPPPPRAPHPISPDSSMLVSALMGLCEMRVPNSKISGSFPL